MEPTLNPYEPPETGEEKPWRQHCPRCDRKPINRGKLVFLGHNREIHCRHCNARLRFHLGRIGNAEVVGLAVSTLALIVGVIAIQLVSFVLFPFLELAAMPLLAGVAVYLIVRKSEFQVANPANPPTPPRSNLGQEKWDIRCPALSQSAGWVVVVATHTASEADRFRTLNEAVGSAWPPWEPSVLLGLPPVAAS